MSKKDPAAAQDRVEQQAQRLEGRTSQTEFISEVARLRILVADDHPMFLKKLTSLLALEFNVVATAADGKSALDLIRSHKPDVVVLDFQMPLLTGMDVTRELAKHPQSPPVVICSMETDSEVQQAVRRAGALGYVLKMRFEKDLILAVKAVVRDKSAPLSAAPTVNDDDFEILPSRA